MMASNANSQSLPSQAKRTSFSGFPGSNASILLEKSKAGMRGSTPDSEVLASSDDEQDHYHRIQSISNALGPKPTRRPSWLTEVQQAPQRKPSLSGSGTFSPTSSHPATPSGDSVSWGANTVPPPGSNIGRGHSNSTSFPWGSAIWNSESQKGPPLRLTEVLPSPTSAVPPGSAGIYNEEALLSPPLGRDSTVDSAIPFAIPLHPTLKTYRSQSYSVGQLDPESTNPLPPNFGGPFINGRSRSGASYAAGLQHRPSRPSMLGEVSHDGSLLGQLREVDDDDESSNGSEAGVQLLGTQARTIEQLAMENAMLRQAAADQMENTRGRNRITSSSSGIKVPRSAAQGNSRRVREAVPEESDYALYEADDSSANPAYNYEGVSRRRLGEYIAKQRTQYSLSGVAENRAVEGVKKGQWQSSLGFAGVAELPQSRRHSFADVPTRPTSISSADEPQNGFAATDRNSGAGGRHTSPAGYGEGLSRPSQGESCEYAHFRSRQSTQEEALELENLHHRNFAASYFSPPIDPSLRGGDGRPSVSPATMHQAFNAHSHLGRSQHLGHPQPRTSQLLYVVTFKACRADIFYVQEGTGLQVKPGDLVIVEADRGTDLGTVAHENISWNKAKELKEHFVEEHYRWLMIFSRHGQNGGTAGLNPNGQTTSSNGAQTSALGAMGISTGQPGQQDVPSTELKPKMIKRLAQAHEIQTLRDKEGNEAKAKRVCQQKVVEHRLNMEILDAEFQMDWKKLTFYYFADSYINFNPLVTDLFKIYKTRIWMSAINPASFVTPVSGLQLPSGLGPGAFGSDPDHFNDRRQQNPHSSFTPVGSVVAPHVGPAGFDRIWDPSRDAIVASGMNFPHIYSQPFQPQDVDPQPLVEQYQMEYRQARQQALGIQQRFTSAPYNLPDLHQSSYHIPHDASGGGTKNPQPLGNDWSHTIQGLSLGS